MRITTCLTYLPGLACGSSGFLYSEPPSMSTSSGMSPEPSIWRLQRTQAPFSCSGMPWRFGRGGVTGLPFTARPWT